MDWEFRVLNYIRDNFTNGFLDVMMPILSLPGTIVALWGLITLIALIIRKHRALGRTMLLDLAVTAINCSVIIKPIVRRLRPYVMNDTINLIVSPEHDFSFPSGHTCFAFSAATICFIYNKPFGTAMYIIASLIAVSRLYLYVHFPTDVLFGIVFGILTALEVYYLEKHFLCDGVPLKDRKALPLRRNRQSTENGLY